MIIRCQGHMAVSSCDVQNFANLLQTCQLGRDSQVGRDRLCSLDCDAIAKQHQFFELADLALLQRVTDCDGAFILQLVASQTVQQEGT